MEQAERLAATGHHHVCLARLYHVRADNQRVGRRRAGRRNGERATGGNAEVTSHQPGSGSGVVRSQQWQPLVTFQHLQEVFLRAVHTSDRGARHQPGLLGRQTRLRQRLADSLDAQQGRPVKHLPRRDMQPTAQLVIGKFHLAARQFVVHGRQVLQGGYARTAFAQRALRLRQADPNG